MTYKIIDFKDRLINETGDDNVNKQADISVMRIVSTLAVILLHTCSALTDNAMIYELSVDQYYVLTDIVHLMTWAVPIFFMVSGALLIDEHKEITYSFIWKKYCKRIILALVIFGVPFSMMEIFVNTREISL